MYVIEETIASSISAVGVLFAMAAYLYAIFAASVLASQKPSIADSLIIDTEQRNAYLDGTPVQLTAKEFDLVELMMRNPGRVYSRDNLLNIVWGYEYPGDVRTVDVHVRRLREKVEANPSEPRYIHTKWGVGYFFQN